VKSKWLFLLISVIPGSQLRVLKKTCTKNLKPEGVFHTQHLLNKRQSQPVNAASPNPRAGGSPERAHCTDAPVPRGLLTSDSDTHMTALPKALTVLMDNIDVPLSSLAKEVCSEFNV